MAIIRPEFNYSFQYPRCDMCMTIFSDERGLLDHKRTMHYREQICTPCKLAFVNEAEYDRHVWRVHTYPYLDATQQMNMQGITVDTVIVDEMQWVTQPSAGTEMQEDFLAAKQEWDKSLIAYVNKLVSDFKRTNPDAPQNGVWQMNRDWFREIKAAYNPLGMGITTTIEGDVVQVGDTHLSGFPIVLDSSYELDLVWWELV